MTRASGACATSRANSSASCAGDASDPLAAARESTAGEPAALAKPAPSEPGALATPAAPRALAPAEPRSGSAAPGRVGGTFRPGDAPRAMPGARRSPTGVGAIPDVAACRRSAAARPADLLGYFEERVFTPSKHPAHASCACSRLRQERPRPQRRPRTAPPSGPRQARPPLPRPPRPSW